MALRSGRRFFRSRRWDLRVDGCFVVRMPVLVDVLDNRGYSRGRGVCGRRGARSRSEE